MDEKKHPTQSQSKPESQKDATAQNSPVGQPAVKRVMSKRWLYPAIYLGAAALIIGLAFARSQMSSKPTMGTSSDTGGTTQTTTAPAAEAFTWPVASSTQPQVTMGFFSNKGTEAQQAAALVYYDHTYYPHMGIDIKSKTGGSFDVTAALSGKVISITDNPNSNQLYGKIIEIQSDNGYVESYESLAAVSVQAGAMVQQGQTIGASGTCDMEQSQGNHLFFEVLKNGTAIDPTTRLPKQ